MQVKATLFMLGRKRQEGALSKRSFCQPRTIFANDKPSGNYHEATFLTERSFDITNCTSTNEARRLLREQTFDVIISDVHMIEDGEEHDDAGYLLLKSPEVESSDVPFIFFLSNVAYLDQEQSENAFGAASDQLDLFNLVLLRAVY